MSPALCLYDHTSFAISIGQSLARSLSEVAGVVSLSIPHLLMMLALLLLGVTQPSFTRAEARNSQEQLQNMF